MGDSHFELIFASVLDSCIDVISHCKLFQQINFKMEYVNSEGGISYYYPDFVVKLSENEHWIVETKGLENFNDPLKIDRLSPHFQIKLIKDGRMDKMIVYTEHYKSEDVEQSYVENLSANLKKRVKDIMGLSIEVDVGKKGSVPRSEGKAVRVIDER